MEQTTSQSRNLDARGVVCSPTSVKARTLTRTPGFTVTALAVLALGIGANTAIFSIVNGILLHPAGIANPEGIAAIRIKYDKLNLKSIGTSAPDFADIRAARDVFTSAAALNQADFNYTGGDVPIRLQGAQVTWQFFDVFEVRPRLGRSFRAEEDAPEVNRVVVLSDAVWKTLFGADPKIVGRFIQLNQQAYEVIGVMGPEFRFPRRADLWSPLGIDPERFGPGNRGNQWLFTVARVRPGLPFEKAVAAVKVLEKQIIEREDKDNTAARVGWGIFAVPFLSVVTGDTRMPLLVLMGAVGFVLLIATSNIAGLMLARASHRAREYSVRVALGASPWRLMRQTFAESLLLSAAGGLIGLVAGIAGSRLLLLLAPANMAEGTIISTDYRVLLFTLAAAVLSATLFGLAPALQMARSNHQLALREGGRSGTSTKARQRVRSALVVAEFALALVLMVGAGLLIRSLARMNSVDAGFDAGGVLTAFTTLPQARYKEAARQAQFYRDAVERLRNTPGVQAAAAASPLPFSGDNSSASFSIPRRAAAGEPQPHGDIRRVTPGYFRALGIPLVRGRFFTEQDTANSAPVAIVDELLAQQYWPGEDPVGQEIAQASKAATIVGVVRHVRHNDLIGEDKKGAYYFPMDQRPLPMAALVARTSAADPASLAGAIREAVRSVDPAQPVHSVKTLAGLVDESLSGRRLATVLLAVFAGLALGLSAIGIYGVISYSVAQRTAEIGIRVALGASRGHVLGMVLGHGALLCGWGILLGLGGAAAIARLLRSELFQVSAFDPLTFAAMAVLLAAIALLATWLPARRALQIDPSEALRYE